MESVQIVHFNPRPDSQKLAPIEEIEEDSDVPLEVVEAEFEQVLEDDDTPILSHSCNELRQRWSNVQDPDAFYRYIYEYHRRGGYWSIVGDEVLEILGRLMMFILSMFFAYGIDYSALFSYADDKPNVTFEDIVLPFNKVVDKFCMWTWVWIVLFTIAFIYYSILSIMKVRNFHETKTFFNEALDIKDSDLEDFVWRDIQKKFLEAKDEVALPATRSEIGELEIHHRIMRQQNYLIAMVNKQIIPPLIRIPIIGEILYWTENLESNLRFILFYSPWGVFKDQWHLRDEYKKKSSRKELADQLRCTIRLIALVNLALCVPIFIWQIINSYFFSAPYCALQDYKQFATPKWSLYGKLYLRHFNELDHELEMRLNMAHKPARKYIQIFFSPILAKLAKFVLILFSAVVVFGYVLSIIHEKVLVMGNAVLNISIIFIILTLCRSLKPIEDTPNSPDILLANVLAHIHYLHHEWKNKAHTKKVKTEFQRLFPIRIQEIVEELISPLVTPFVLFFYVAPRSGDIVEFFCNFTVSLRGVGDVCSFAEMNIKKHGNLTWHKSSANIRSVATQYQQSEDGKVELSLLHFKQWNPFWEPPVDTEAQAFLRSLHDHQDEIDNIMDSDLSLSIYKSCVQHSQTSQLEEDPDMVAAKEVSRGALFLHSVRDENQQMQSTLFI